MTLVMEAMDYKLLEITQQNVYVNITVELDIVIRPMNTHSHSQIKKKGKKAVTGAVPFQKVHFCTQRLYIGTLVVH